MKGEKPSTLRNWREVTDTPRQFCRLGSSLDGTTATVVLKEPYETARSEIAPYQPWTDNGDGNVTLNVEVVPGLYYAADSAGTIEALKRPGAADPAKAGDAIVAPKQEGAQGFYKVWVSDAPIAAE